MEMQIPALHTDVTDSILRCAVAVHKELGPALAEHSYQTALALEMRANALCFVERSPITIRFRDVVVGWHTPDFIVEDKVVVELKAVANFDSVHTKQVLTYLKVTGLRVGLLINFNVASFASTGIKRIQL